MYEETDKSKLLKLTLSGAVSTHFKHMLRSEIHTTITLVTRVARLAAYEIRDPTLGMLGFSSEVCIHGEENTTPFSLYK